MELIANGRDADVFALDEGRVLRRCRRPDTDCRHEAQIMEWTHTHGYPVPRVYSVDGPDLVLERIDGPTMLDSLLAGTTSMADGGAMLADLHTRLHAIPTPDGTDPGLAIVHLDLHPMNIMLTAEGPVVIDWANTDLRRAGVDVALTGIILAQVASIEGPLTELAGLLLRCFLDAVGPIAPEDTRDAVAYRTANPTMTSLEIDVLPESARLITR